MSKEITKRKAIIKNALYNHQTRSVKMHLHLEDDGFYLAADAPAFIEGYIQPGMDVYQEGIKAAKNLIGCPVSIEFNGEINPNG